MIKQRAITYGLLAHIREKATLVEGPLDIFLPLLKHVLSKFYSDGQTKGKSLFELKTYMDDLYSIEFPIPVIKTLFQKVCSEINVNGVEHLVLHNDGSFIIKDYDFSDFNEMMEIHKSEVERIEKYFIEFCTSSKKIDCYGASIFDFLEYNKQSLGRYLSNTEVSNIDFSIEAEFVAFFKRIPPLYDEIKRIYLGSILSSYLTFKSEFKGQRIELLFDTNFILGLLDLNTPESKHTCQSLLQISKSNGYAFSILNDTLEEIQSLLYAKAKHFDQTFLLKKVFSEDIYNACDRRNLGAADLERIADNIEEEVSKYDISIVYNTEKYRNLAKNSSEFEVLKKVRNSESAAMHDAIALKYVQEKRKKTIYEFDKANCWFVNNSINRFGNVSYRTSGRQPEAIKADDLLNILWLSNPQIYVDLKPGKISEIGLSSLISLSINKSLPKTALIRELDENIHKYASEAISDADIVKIATRITSKQLENISSLNEIALSDKEEFVKRLQNEANKQQEIENDRIKKIEDAIIVLTNKSSKLDEKRNEYEEIIKNKVATEKEIDDIVSRNEILSNELSAKNNELNQLKSDIDKYNLEKKKRELDNYCTENIWEWRKNAWYSLFTFIFILLVMRVFEKVCQNS